MRKIPPPGKPQHVRRLDRTGETASTWPQPLLVVVIAAASFLACGTLIRRWDASAGVMDAGILSVLPLALLVVGLARLSAAGIYQLMVGRVNELTVWQRTLCYGCLHLSYFWAVVLVVTRLV